MADASITRAAERLTLACRALSAAADVWLWRTVETGYRWAALRTSWKRRRSACARWPISLRPSLGTLGHSLALQAEKPSAFAAVCGG
jgi:hypothetical protein